MDKCGEQYRLRYRQHAPQREMWAGVGGSAYHACVEGFEREVGADGQFGYFSALDDDDTWDAEATLRADRFRQAFAEETVERVLKNPDYPPSEWYVNSKGEGRDWWLEHGPQMVYRYVMAQRGRQFTVLATEVHAEMTISSVEVHGYIDRVEYQAAGRKLTITDDKTGRLPDDRHQLDFYALWASRQDWGVSVDEVWSRWYNARTGEYKYARLFNPNVDEIALHRRYAVLDLLDGHQIYPPRPSTSNCKPCPVRSSCSLSAWRD